MWSRVIVVLAFSTSLCIAEDFPDKIWRDVKVSGDFPSAFNDFSNSVSSLFSSEVKEMKCINTNCYAESFKNAAYSITSIVCKNCSIVQLSPETFNAQRWRLNSVSITDTPIPIIEDGIFAKQPTLFKLTLVNVSIPSIRSTWFENMTYLQTLTLSGNKDLSAIPPRGFRFLGQLKTLQLMKNGLRRIYVDSFEGLNNLWGLDLSSNKLTYIPDGTFTRLPVLGLLSLANNPMISIDLHTITNMPTLIVNVIRDGWPCQTLRKNPVQNAKPEYSQNINNLIEFPAPQYRWWTAVENNIPCVEIRRKVNPNVEKQLLSGSYFDGQTRQFFDRLLTFKALFKLMDTKQCFALQRYAALPVLKDLEDCGYKVQRPVQKHIQEKAALDAREYYEK